MRFVSLSNAVTRRPSSLSNGGLRVFRRAAAYHDVDRPHEKRLTGGGWPTSHWTPSLLRSWPPSASRRGCVARTPRRPQAKSSGVSAWSSRASGQGSTLRISMSSIAKHALSVSSATGASTAPRSSGPASAGGEEHLAPLPAAFASERFATEDRKVSWDGSISYGGVHAGTVGASGRRHQRADPGNGRASSRSGGRGSCSSR
jgi:hypothetical protein